MSFHSRSVFGFVIGHALIVGRVKAPLTIFEGCDAFERDAKAVNVRESSWVVDEFHVLSKAPT